jgi:hypothetical protein
MCDRPSKRQSPETPTPTMEIPQSSSGGRAVESWQSFASSRSNSTPTIPQRPVSEGLPLPQSSLTNQECVPLRVDIMHDLTIVNINPGMCDVLSLTNSTRRNFGRFVGRSSCEEALGSPRRTQTEEMRLALWNRFTSHLQQVWAHRLDSRIP